ncbi:MAG: BT4734/BF3469 family protein [Lentimicrobiaceae bacterium]|jgi:hypothetical protein
MNFSILNRITAQVPSATLSLDEFVSILHNPANGSAQYIKASNIVDKIRSISDEDRQKELKQTLPVVAPGVVFGANRQDIKSFSGLMQIDIDHVTNPELLRDELGKLSWITLSALSVRKGVWLLVKIPEPERQAEYWAKVNAWLINQYGIESDPARKNAKDLRFYSPDKDAVYNPHAATLNIIPAPSASKQVKALQIEKRMNSGLFFSPIDDFNSRADVIPLLLSHDWKVCNQHGINIRLTRPGKSFGISANWNEELRKLYVFSSNSNLIQSKGKHPLSATDIFMQLNHISCIAIAREQLLSMGFGYQHK